MAEFIKYQHIERLGNDAVDGIENGKCYIFPKIDGTNSSMWLKGWVYNTTIPLFGYGSRNRELSLEKDNHGFMAWGKSYDSHNHRNFLKDHPSLRLFGEWLVPHSLKTYRGDSWRRFYVFDVYDNATGLPVNYDKYKCQLDKYGIDYIPPLDIMVNPTHEDITSLTKNNTYLIRNDEGNGEGVVVKNYDFVNRWGRVIWAKVVTSEFKDRNRKEFGMKVADKRVIEQKIVDKFVTAALCEKEYSKVVTEVGHWQSSNIPRLLSVVYHCLIEEEMWNILKKHKNSKIDFKRLQQLTQIKTKEHLHKLF